MSAAVIRRMLSAGLTIEQALLALESIEAEEAAKLDAAKEKSRASNAERQRRFRAKKSDNDVTPVTPVTPVTRDIVTDNEPYIARAGAPVFPVGISNEIPKLDTPLPSEGPQAEKRKSGTCLPDDWSPPEELFAYGAEHGLNRSQTSEILEDMRIWARANRNRAVARKADWTLTAQGFIRRDAKKFNARAGPVHHSNGGGWGTIFTGLEENGRTREGQGTGEIVPLLSERKEPGFAELRTNDGGLRRDAEPAFRRDRG